MSGKVIVVHTGPAPQVQEVAGRPVHWVSSGIEWELGRVMPSHIDAELCSGCRTCEPVCPSGSLHFDEDREVMTVNPFSCKGCGSCVAACPSGVPFQAALSCREVIASLEAIMANGDSGSGVAAEPDVPRSREEVVIRWFAEDHAEPGLVMEALERGYDFVVVAGGVPRPPESGHAERVTATSRRVLEALGLEPDRVEALAGTVDVEEALGGIVDRAQQLGPNPIRLEVTP